MQHKWFARWRTTEITPAGSSASRLGRLRWQSSLPCPVRREKEERDHEGGDTLYRCTTVEGKKRKAQRQEEPGRVSGPIIRPCHGLHPVFFFYGTKCGIPLSLPTCVVKPCRNWIYPDFARPLKIAWGDVISCLSRTFDYLRFPCTPLPFLLDSGYIQISSLP